MLKSVSCLKFTEPFKCGEERKAGVKIKTIKVFVFKNFIK